MYGRSYLNTINNASKLMNYETPTTTSKYEMPRIEPELPRRDAEVPRRRELEMTDPYDFLNATPPRMNTTTSTLSPYSSYRKYVLYSVSSINIIFRSIPVSSFNTPKTTAPITTQSRLPPGRSGMDAELKETTPSSYFRTRTAPTAPSVYKPERPSHFLSSTFYEALNKNNKVKRDDAYP